MKFKFYSILDDNGLKAFLTMRIDNYFDGFLVLNKITKYKTRIQVM